MLMCHRWTLTSKINFGFVVEKHFSCIFSSTLQKPVNVTYLRAAAAVSLQFQKIWASFLKEAKWCWVWGDLIYNRHMFLIWIPAVVHFFFLESQHPVTQMCYYWVTHFTVFLATTVLFILLHRAVKSTIVPSQRRSAPPPVWRWLCWPWTWVWLVSWRAWTPLQARVTPHLLPLHRLSWGCGCCRCLPSHRASASAAAPQSPPPPTGIQESRGWGSQEPGGYKRETRWNDVESRTRWRPKGDGYYTVVQWNCRIAVEVWPQAAI